MSVEHLMQHDVFAITSFHVSRLLPSHLMEWRTIMILISGLLPGVYPFPMAFSNESELSLDVRLGGPRRVNLPRRGYLVVLCPKVDASKSA